MGRTRNLLKGVNRVCSQCRETCKQYEVAILVACPKFRSTQSETHSPCSYKNRSRMKESGGKNDC